MSKKQEIQGVSGSSLVDLRAVLFEAEANARSGKPRAQPTSKPLKEISKLEIKNPGVENRDFRDREAIKKKDPAEILRAKVEQYEKLSSGQGLDFLAEEDENAPLIDFEQKYYDDRSSAKKSSRDAKKKDWASTILEDPERAAAQVKAQLDASKDTESARTTLADKKQKRQDAKEDRLAKIRKLESARKSSSIDQSLLETIQSTR
eukprot:TRINITY_DN2096_c1_g1::TRINITY_DN2096_c1_g1_i1::g.21767::m.21767 TRINITY_DN2096_c1_g1::TRINITY_DN2096_c1_g1_i1::g.21767  ORF type:complete len:205 (+),score=12.06,DUF4445/PF14574.1/0.041,DUF3785/PF12653.2/5.9e+03,DUF3785/PF12653.2/0.078,DUF4078/PF13300.1/1.4e+03,DUF4078/PF13300.1/0.79 TRINITY_DN2096_c1_g1_i1:83-697(+)